MRCILDYMPMLLGSLHRVNITASCVTPRGGGMAWCLCVATTASISPWQEPLIKTHFTGLIISGADRCGNNTKKGDLTASSL